MVSLVVRSLFCERDEQARSVGDQINDYGGSGVCLRRGHELFPSSSNIFGPSSNIISDLMRAISCMSLGRSGLGKADAFETAAEVTKLLTEQWDTFSRFFTIFSRFLVSSGETTVAIDERTTARGSTMVLEATSR